MARHNAIRSTLTPPIERSAATGTWLVALAIGGVSFAAYLATLYPSVAGGDSGELTVVAATGGVAHPPGYPLYTMLARMFASLPMGSIAWRVNLLSAACAATASALLTHTVRRWTGRVAAAVLSGGLFAFAPLTWSYATNAEVFPLHCVFVVAIIACVTRWPAKPTRGTAATFAFISGLGLAHHHTLVLLIAPAAVWGFATRPSRWSVGDLATLTAAFALGLAPYLYLPIAAASGPAVVWGDFSSWAGFVAHLTRADYGSLQLGADRVGVEGLFWAQLGYYARSLVENTLGIGALAALWVAVTNWRDWRRPPALLAAALVCYLVVFHALANLPVRDPLFREVTARFWHQPHLLVFALAGFGFAQLEPAIDRVRPHASLVLALLVVALQFGLHLRSHDHSANQHFANYARAILEPLPPRAILLTHGDLITNTVRYVDLCERFRDDVVVLDQEMMTKPWYIATQARLHPDIVFPGRLYDPRVAGGFTMAMFIEANRTTRPIYVYPELKSGDASTSGRYELWPEGFASRLLATAKPPPIDDWMRRADDAWRRIEQTRWPTWDAYGPESWERVVALDVWHARHEMGYRALTFALANGAPRELLEFAARALSEAIAAQPEPPTYMLKNLGIAEQRLSIYDASHGAKAVATWQRFLALAPANDPDRAAIAGALRQLGVTDQ